MAYKQGGGGGGGGGAPTDATYIVQTANGTLTQERVATDTATVAWDFGTPGQARLNVVPAYLTANQTITLSGDASGSGTTAITVTLATVPVNKGGTGATSFTAGAVLLGNGTSAIAVDTGLTFDTATDKLTVGGDVQIGATGRIDRGTNPLIRANGTDNLFIGNPAGGGSVTTANINAGVGVDALRDITGGSNNVAIGTRALRNLQGGSQNVAIGPEAMIAGTGPTSNSAIGFSAGYNLAGTNNEAIGANALANASSGSLFGNTAVGSSALTGITTSGVSYNVGIGFQAGDTIGTGSQNTIIGASADVSASGAANRIAVGYNVSADTDNQAFLGNASVTAWVPGATNAASLGRSDRVFTTLFLNGSTVRAGTGSPESAVTATVGSIFLRSDGGTGTSAYIKESGSGNTGWVAVAAGGGGGMGDPGSNGVVVRTALNTTTARTITAGAGITVTNGDGVSGTPTIARKDQLNAAVAAQGPGFSSDTYVTNSDNVIPSGGFVAKTVLRYIIVAEKTAAGTAAPVVTIRTGSGRATSDTSRLALTGPAQTAAIATGVLEIVVTIRTGGATTVMEGVMSWKKNSASAGFSNNLHGYARGTGGSFDSTGLGGQYVGISINGGASAAWTLYQVTAEYMEP